MKRAQPERNNVKKKVFLDFLIPVLILAALTAVISLLGLDLRLESFFYKTGKGWFLGDKGIWYALYHYGTIPVVLFLLGSIVVLVLGFWNKKYLRFRKISLFFILTLILGPGLIINTAFKDHWGRPRPREIVQLGGSEVFHEVWQPGRNGVGKSFPSGHGSAGFIFLIPFLLLRRRYPAAAAGFLIFGLLFGSFMGLARMVQGGHFASDVIWAGGFVYLSALAVFYSLGLHKNFFNGPVNITSTAGRSVRSKVLLTAGLVLLSLLIFGGIFLATPYDGNGGFYPGTYPVYRELVLVVPSRTDLRIQKRNEPVSYWEALGFGFPKSRVVFSQKVSGNTNYFNYQTRGFFSELSLKLSIYTGDLSGRDHVIVRRQGISTNLIFSLK
jgi:lipid A 4'-phosphatase